MKNYFFQVVFVIFLIGVCSAHAQPVATASNGFLLSDSTTFSAANASGTAFPATVSEPLFLDQPTASMPFVIDSDPFSTSLRIITALFAVILIAFALSWAIQKKGGFGFGGNVFGKVIGVLPLDSKRFIYLVDIVGRVIVLGVTDNNINFLCEISDKDTVDSLRLQGQTTTMPGMEKIFSFLKGSKEDRQDDQSFETQVSETNLKNQTEKNQERLRKINSLLVKRNPADPRDLD